MEVVTVVVMNVVVVTCAFVMDEIAHVDL